MRASVVKRAALTKKGAAQVTKRRSAAILRCKDGNMNLERGRGVLTNLHLRGAVHAKKRASIFMGAILPKNGRRNKDAFSRYGRADGAFSWRKQSA